MPMNTMSFSDETLTKLGFPNTMVTQADHKSTNVTSVGRFFTVTSKAKENVRYTQNRASFYVCEFPGCCGALVAHHLVAYDREDRKAALRMLEDIARQNGTPFMMYSVRKCGDELTKAFEDAGWTPVAFWHQHYSGKSEMIFFHKMIGLKA